MVLALSYVFVIFRREEEEIRTLNEDLARLYAVEQNIADTLQAALLTMPQKIKGIEFGYLYRSATEAAKVGGDFYDLFELEHNRVGIINLIG